ncbi:hypothetical protein POREN0001_0582 [Porphyromonas endodontalis ATCC 35406]|uniref:Uncharacterized protein n=1 Tax=Porphyromonas endodontalis (strain ATCC 35406 / DSM 24491 / JCM 8526 / CCUG 16442 / BCRC 14492 / NCTC 13058 / HG 370) TaxID=553175 RepID=C3J8R3_POREA|nr:hypothetical protein POREN0001_0582 [Porphyromonas endodontalis ATCC 35406]
MYKGFSFLCTLLYLNQKVFSPFLQTENSPFLLGKSIRKDSHWRTLSKDY